MAIGRCHNVHSRGNIISCHTRLCSVVCIAEGCIFFNFEGSFDVDTPAVDTTTPIEQQAYMTSDRTYMLNS